MIKKSTFKCISGLVSLEIGKADVYNWTARINQKFGSTISEAAGLRKLPRKPGCGNGRSRRSGGPLDAFFAQFQRSSTVGHSMCGYCLRAYNLVGFTLGISLPGIIGDKK